MNYTPEQLRCKQCGNHEYHYHFQVVRCLVKRPMMATVFESEVPMDSPVETVTYDIRDEFRPGFGLRRYIMGRKNWGWAWTK